MATWDAPGAIVEKNSKIARFDRVGVHHRAGLKLLDDQPWHRHAVPPEHVLDKAATVESRGVGPAVSIRRARE